MEWKARSEARTCSESPTRRGTPKAFKYLKYMEETFRPFNFIFWLSNRSSMKKLKIPVRNIRKRKRAGSPPGTVLYTGEGRGGKTEISFYQYSMDFVIQESTLDTDEVLERVKENTVNWINVNGLEDTEVILKIGDRFSIHPLALEDIVNIHQRPKFEDFEDHLFFCLKMFSLNESGKIEWEHVSFILGKNYLLSFQERQGDLFDPVRERITATKGRLRQRSNDYLFYCLVDVIVDNYYHVIDYLNDTIYNLEDDIINEGKRDVVEQIQQLKKQVSTFRKMVVPLREGLVKMIREDEENLISSGTLTYFNDVIDHSNYIIESAATAREVLNSCMELHMANLSQGMNNVMKTLTIISTVFIPLTFIAGVYGMNFDNMPELHFENGYYMSLVLMAVVGLLMFIFMKRKHWF